jgi:hypothetical protein
MGASQFMRYQIVSNPEIYRENCHMCGQEIEVPEGPKIVVQTARDGDCLVCGPCAEEHAPHIWEELKQQISRT